MEEKEKCDLEGDRMGERVLGKKEKMAKIRERREEKGDSAEER